MPVTLADVDLVLSIVPELEELSGSGVDLADTIIGKAVKNWPKIEAATKVKT